MFKGRYWLSNHLKPVCLALLIVLLIGFNFILSNALHLKIYRAGHQLVKQVYELQLNAPLDQKTLAALVKSNGFMLSAEPSSGHFKNLIKPELKVFSYKTLNLGLYHPPVWIMESYLFILLNLIVLGSASSLYRWGNAVNLKQLKRLNSQPKELKLPSDTCDRVDIVKTVKSDELGSLYAAAEQYHSLFILVSWDCEFDKNTDLETSFKVLILKSVPEIKKIAVKVINPEQLTITLYNVPIAELDRYTERLYKIIFNVCQSHQKSTTRKHVKLGACNFRLGADQSKVLQIAKAALTLSQNSMLLHRHRLALSKSQEVLFCNEQVINNIKKNKFMLSFQPVFDLISGDIIQHEALIRVRHDMHGLLAAQYFINQVESKNDALILDKAVLSQILTLVMAEKSPLSVSINMHPNNWLNEEFWSWLSTQMDRLNLSCQLQFEMSEAFFCNNKDALANTLNIIKKHRSNIIIDNVKTSENIPLLIHCEEVIGLKLSYDLVHLVNEKSHNQKCIKNIVNAGKMLNLPVYAVGVETQKELIMLTKLGVAGAQGFYFSEPLQELTQAVFH
jgi:RNase E specificity factor CsrD